MLFRSVMNPTTYTNEEETRYSYGSIVFDSNMTSVDYTAEADSENDAYLRIVTDLSDPSLTDEIGLFLSKDTISAMMKDGFDIVVFIVEDASLEITLDELSDSWFDTDEAINMYVTWLNAKYQTEGGQKGTLVRIEAITENETVVIGDMFSGLKLVSGGAEADVSINGVYVKN